MFSKEQIRVLIRKGQRIEAYFDTTGSVIRPSVCDVGHRSLYYTIVVNVGSQIVLIAKLISSKHDSAATITGFLLQFKHFMRTTCKKTPIFNVVVTDWSFALMTSVSQGFNDMTFYTSLMAAYRFVTNRLDDFRVFSMVV